MKKLTALFLSLAMVLGLAACGSGTPSSSESGTLDSSASQASNETSSSQPEISENTSPEAGKTLVVYFSATGNTEEAANAVAQLTGGDLFELEPADPYTDDDLDWTVEGSRVNVEHEDESLRNIELVADTVDDWNSYDTVFIGYPSWWGIAAWPVNTFVEANDFTGKTVIPFCTSASSGLGQSGELLANLAGTGDWQEGQRFASSVSQEDVQEWLDSLEI